MQGRIADAGLRLGIGSSIQECLDDRRVSCSGCRYECRQIEGGPTVIHRGLYVCAGVDQLQCNRRIVVFEYRHVQGSLTVGILRLDIGSTIQQDLDDHGTLGQSCRQVQGGIAALGICVDVRSSLQQDIEDRWVLAIAHGEKKWRIPAAFPLVDVCAAGQLGAHFLDACDAPEDRTQPASRFVGRTRGIGRLRCRVSRWRGRFGG